MVMKMTEMMIMFIIDNVTSSVGGRFGNNKKNIMT